LCGASELRKHGRVNTEKTDMTEHIGIAGPGIRQTPGRRARGGRELRCALVSIVLAAVCLPAAGLAQNSYRALVAAHETPTPGVDGVAGPSSCRRLPPLTNAFSAWWDEAVHRPLHADGAARYMTIESLIVVALQSSSRVSVMTDIPLIRRTSIVEAEANFDWRAFVDTEWNDVDEPVGDFAIGGGQTRLLNEDLDYRMGARRRNIHGGRFEIAQEFGWEDSNSNFFIPKNQGFAQLTVSYRHPLWRGAGVNYNSGPIVLAQIDTRIAGDELSKRLQDYVMELVRAYWRLYLERGYVLQQRQALERAYSILKQLEPRVDIDAPLSQIARTRAAAATRRAELIRAETAARDAQSRIQTLVSDAVIGDPLAVELLPMDRPSPHLMQIDFPQAVQTALRFRPEIGQAIKEIRATATRLEMSKNELLPVLDLILETYVQGLESRSDVPRAFADQFSTGAPSYTVGLQFEVPIHFRAARARFERRNLELRQVTKQLNVTTETLVAEVDKVVRNVGASHKEMQANFAAMQAAETEVKYIQRRWQQLKGDDRIGSVVLKDLLDAQDRLTLAEFRFLRAQVDYSLSLVNLQKATGMLLHHERICFWEARVCGLPEIILDKPVVQRPVPAPLEPRTPDARWRSPLPPVRR